MKSITRLFIRCILALLSIWPDLKRQCAIVVKKLGLYENLSSFYCPPLQVEADIASKHPASLKAAIASKQLTPRAHLIYVELKARAAIEEHHIKSD